MNWIIDRDTFKSINKKDLLVVYARPWSQRDNSDYPYKHYIAYSDSDNDFDCAFTDNTLNASAAMRILTPESKWLDDASSISSTRKYIVWGYEYDSNKGIE